jgi:hypothetical protein
MIVVMLPKSRKARLRLRLKNKASNFEALRNGEFLNQNYSRHKENCKHERKSYLKQWVWLLRN